MRTLMVLLLTLLIGAAALPAQERVRHRSRPAHKMFKHERHRERTPRIRRDYRPPARVFLRRQRARI
jgi:hypothetical protein